MKNKYSDEFISHIQEHLRESMIRCSTNKRIAIRNESAKFKTAGLSQSGTLVKIITKLEIESIRSFIEDSINWIESRQSLFNHVYTAEEIDVIKSLMISKLDILFSAVSSEIDEVVNDSGNNKLQINDMEIRNAHSEIAHIIENQFKIIAQSIHLTKDNEEIRQSKKSNRINLVSVVITLIFTVINIFLTLKK